MCKYCKRRKDIKFDWEQPKLPYHDNKRIDYTLSGNIPQINDFEGEIRDHKRTTPQLILSCRGYFGGEGIGTIYIPIKYCPECGRKLGEKDMKFNKEKILERITNEGTENIYILDMLETYLEETEEENVNKEYMTFVKGIIDNSQSIEDIVNKMAIIMKTKKGKELLEESYDCVIKEELYKNVSDIFEPNYEDKVIVETIYQCQDILKEVLIEMYSQKSYT